MQGRIHIDSSQLSRTYRRVFLLPLAALVALFAISCGASSSNNSGPVANAGGPYVTNAGQALTFNGSLSSAPSGQSLTYAWNFGDGTTGTGVMITHTYANPGNFFATLTVKDTQGATNSNTVTVLVINLPVSNPGGPYTGVAGQPVSFNGSNSTVPVGQNGAFTWNFGDGTTGSGETTTHTYSSSGMFSVSLTVVDDTGGRDSASTTATISAAGPATPSAKAFLAIGAAAPGQPRVAYIASTSAGGVNTVSVDGIAPATGALTPINSIQLSPSGGFNLQGIALDSASKYLYAVGANAILTFATDPATGALTQQNSAAISGGATNSGGQTFAFHPSGKFAYLLTHESDLSNPNSSSMIFLYSVDSTSGALQFSNGFSAQIPNSNSVVVDPEGKFLYVSGSPSGDVTTASIIAAFSINQATGTLNPVPGSPFEFSSRVCVTAMATDPAGQFVYAAGNSLDSGAATLSVYSVDRNTGALSEFPGLTYSAGSAGSIADSIALDRTGKFAYVLTETLVSQSASQENVQVFSLNAATGAASPATNVAMPASIPIISGATGSLALFSSGIPISASAAASVQIGSPTFIYVIGPGGSGISVFSMDVSTGALTTIQQAMPPPAAMPAAATSH